MNLIQIDNYRTQCISIKVEIWVIKKVIDMKKLFGTIGRLKLFRLIRGVRMGDMDASLRTDSNEDREQTKTFSSDAYVLAKKRMHEIETQKAMVILESRHCTWKAGGPL